MGGSLPSSLAKKVQKGKQKITKIVVHEEIRSEDEDLHETEQDFDLVNLDEHDENEDISIKIIKEKYALIRDVQANL